MLLASSARITLRTEPPPGRRKRKAVRPSALRLCEVMTVSPWARAMRSTSASGTVLGICSTTSFWMKRVSLSGGMPRHLLETVGADAALGIDDRADREGRARQQPGRHVAEGGVGADQRAGDAAGAARHRAAAGRVQDGAEIHAGESAGDVVAAG